jgi:hypothetical protein
MMETEEELEARLTALESAIEEQAATIEAQRCRLEAAASGEAPAATGDSVDVASSVSTRQPASSTYKVRGEFAAADGTGVLGRNTAGSGTPIGVEGAVPNAAEGFGLSTPDDANVGGTLRAGAIRSALGDAQIQAAFDGLVVPVAPGLGLADAVDPSTTTTPVQDAIDAIDATGWYLDEWSPGAVLLPTGTIEEAGPLTHTLTKTFLGWGIHATELRFPATDAPAIEQVPISGWPGDCMRTYWDGIRFHGVDGAARTAPAVRIDEDLVRAFNVGRIAFQEWNDVIVHRGGTWYESHWDWVTAEDVYGRSIVVENVPFGGSAWTIDKLNCYRDNGAGRVIDARGSHGGNVMIRDFHVQVNADGTNGGSGPPAVEVDGPTTGRFQIDNLHYETTVGLDLPAVVRLGGGTQYRIDMVDILGPNDQSGESLVVDHVVALDTVGQVAIGQHTKQPDATSIRESYLGVAGSPLPGAVRFHGRSDQVTETFGSTAGKIFALEDMRVVDPMYSASVTHTSGGPTEVDGINQGQTGSRPDGVRRVTPRIQRLDPVALPNADFAVTHRFEWRGSGSYERWVLVLDWATDPGVDIDFDLEVTTRGFG